MTWGWLGLASVAAGWKGASVFLMVSTWHAWRRRRQRPPAVEDRDVDDLAVLVVIGLGASHTLAGALELGARELGGPIAGEVGELLRRARLRGLAAALAETGGPLGPLTTQLARAQLTGAPMVDAVAAFLQTRRSVARSALLESARTLPVRLIVPVTLLLLPGFVVLLMAPFVADQLAHLVGSGVP